MNLKLIKKRLKHLYSNWNQHKSDLWSKSDILIVSSSSQQSTSVSHKFFIWLLGYPLPNTIAVFTPKEIHFICNKQKAVVLKPLVGDDGLDIEIIVHEKKGDDDDDGVLIMDRVLMDLRVQSRLKYLSFIVSKNRYDFDVDNDHGNGNGNGNGRDKENDSPLVVGCVEGECPAWGKLMKKKANEFRIVDIKDGLSKFALLAKVNNVEEDEEVESVFWRFKRSQEKQKLVTGDTEKEIDIYLQELSKEAEEKILLAEVKKLEDEFGSSGIRKRRSVVVEELDSDEWVFV